MATTDLQRHLEFLTDRWCARRTLEPLRRLLNARAALNGLTDGWSDFRFELQSIRADFQSDLESDEFDALVDAIDIADNALSETD
ncbi:MAG: hypothetical protein AAGL69_14970 [Pseudomonadota bacterium]